MVRNKKKIVMKEVVIWVGSELMRLHQHTVMQGGSPKENYAIAGDLRFRKHVVGDPGLLVLPEAIASVCTYTN